MRELLERIRLALLEARQEQMKQSIKEEGTETEVFEVTKNGVKTTVVYTFNSKGYPIQSELKVEQLEVEDTVEQLQAKLAEAIEKQDFETAVLLRDKINNKTN